MGPGQDKTAYSRVFDHWGNFDHFEMGYQPAEAGAEQSRVMQLVFEERLTLAETALRKSEISVFEKGDRSNQPPT